MILLILLFLVYISFLLRELNKPTEILSNDLLEEIQDKIIAELGISVAIIDGAYYPECEVTLTYKGEELERSVCRWV